MRSALTSWGLLIDDQPQDHHDDIYDGRQYARHLAQRAKRMHRVCLKPARARSCAADRFRRRCLWAQWAGFTDGRQQSAGCGGETAALAGTQIVIAPGWTLTRSFVTVVRAPPSSS